MRLLIAEDEKDLVDSLISLSRMDEEQPQVLCDFNISDAVFETAESLPILQRRRATRSLPISKMTLFSKATNIPSAGLYPY